MQDSLEPKLKTKIARYHISAVKQLKDVKGHVNARYMTAHQHQRLVENIRRDGCLTSLPLVGRCVAGAGELMVISGNHRVEAAREAGIAEIDVIEIIEPLPKKRLIAIQLAHNAIEGQDDKAVLKSLFDELSVEWQEYSGLTEDSFDLDDINVQVISGTHPLYKEIIISFLGNDASKLEEFFKSAETWAKKNRPVFAARMEEFIGFFDAVVRAKKVKNVRNTAVAMSVLIEMDNERMMQIEGEQADERAKA